MKTFLVLVLALVMVVLPVKAQDTALSCDAATLTAVSDALTAANDAARAAIAAGDLSGAINGLANASARVQIMQATCAGLAFAGDAATVVGPVELAEGVYKATATTDGFMIVNITALSGECGAGNKLFMTPGLFILSKGQAANGAETVLFSAGCTALLEVSNVQSGWALRLEKLG
jgi:hypothetical protein